MSIRFHRISSPCGDQRTGPTGDVVDVSVADFRAMLVHEVTENKHSVGSWCPVDFDYPDPALRGKRHKALVVGASASVWLDIDKLPEEQWSKVLDFVRQQNWQAEAWTTHSYQPGGAVSCRMRVTVDRPHASGDEVRGAREGLSRALTAALDPVLAAGDRRGLITDYACFQPASIFYRPAVHPSRQGTGKVWTFDGLRRPRVSDLIEQAAECARENKRLELVAAGKIADRAADEPATPEDTAAQQAWFTHQLEKLSTPDELSGRKNRLFAYGSRLAACVATGGLDLTVCMQTVQSAFLTNRPQDSDVCLQHFVNGVENGKDLAPIRAEDAVIDAALAEDAPDSGADARVRRQLLQAPVEAGSLEDARAALVGAVAQAAAFRSRADREVLVVQAPAGLGKTRTTAARLAENVRAGAWSLIRVPDHAVAQELLHAMPEDVRDGVVHLHSPLVEVPGQPTCPRPDIERARDLVFKFGAKQHEVCKTCPYAATCEAKKAWESRNRRAKNAPLVIATYQNEGAGGEDADRPRILIVDEQPPVVTTLELPSKTLAAASLLPVDALDVALRALKTGTLPPSVPSYIPTVADSVHPAVAAAESAAADVVAFLRLAMSPGATYTRRPDGTHYAAGRSATMRELEEKGGTLLSATPATDALDGARFIRLAVAKHPNHTRVMFPLAKSGRQELAARAVEAAGRRVGLEAGEGRGLLVSFKDRVVGKDGRPVIAVPPNVDVAYYGAVRGKNTWRSHTAVICVGVPWDKHLEAAVALGHTPGSQGAWSFAKARAADELRQAVERIRSVSRPDEALWMAVVGSVVPTGWSAADAAVSPWVGADADLVAAAVEAAGGQRELSRRLGVSQQAVSGWLAGDRPVPKKRMEALRVLLDEEGVR